MGVRESAFEIGSSLLVHSGLRNWRLAHWLRSAAAAVVAPMDFRSAQRKWLLDPTLSSEEKSLLARVSLRVHRNDGMYIPLDARFYLWAGLSAIRCIENALQKSGSLRTVRAILDLPCGYGRVLRFLRAKFPDTEITASELDSGALEFCRETLGVKIVESNTNLGKLSVPGCFDLIWCGSLLTHLDEGSAAKLIRFFHEHLASGGVCLFTTHGTEPVNRIRSTRRAYGLSDAARQELLAQYDRRGYGYADYSGQPGYGVSVASPERMVSLASEVGAWKEIRCLERGWANHQDVFIAEAR